MNATALDTSVWRVVGDPLVAPTAGGRLDGETVAVKDVYAVAGHCVGAGNPTWLDSTAPAQVHAAAVADLLACGAAVRGIAATDEFAYSLAGTNSHYGTPPNPRAPGRISGGSSSGPASAVAVGEATIGLGTDTGGSIRVPAAYQGLYGIRTTHGLLDRTGLLPLAPSFDTVGWLTASAGLLLRVGDVLLPAASAVDVTELVLAPALLAPADDDVADAVRRFASSAATIAWSPDLAAWAEAFRVVQAAEAWRAHGPWLGGRLDALGPDVRARFMAASEVTVEQEDAARRRLIAVRDEIRDVVGDRVLVLPSAPSVAPRTGDDLTAVREATLRLTCVAGLAGLPAVAVPLTTAAGLPCGACLVAAPGRDRDLLATAAAVAT